ncbi:MAG: acyl-CoA transferase [Gammaproteobacteria bacterium]|nr:acyl-CoA transferase [Gammaproteobacteria bacterium]
MLQHILKSLSYGQSDDDHETDEDGISFAGIDVLPSCFETTRLASCSIMAAAISLRRLFQADKNPTSNQIRVNRRLASLWFGQSIVPEGWKLPPVWDEIAGDYRCRDNWIRLHTNAVHHRESALRVLACNADRERLRQAVQNWGATELETAIVEAGGCAAEMMSVDQWCAHPQGKAVQAEPLISWEDNGYFSGQPLSVSRCKPLNQFRVLDLTRIIAGPVATRFLAAYGAEVLRIDPVNLWDDSSNAAEMAVGKRCAGLDLRKPQGRDRFAKLVSEADILVHGYRPGAIESLGFGDKQCRSLNAKLIIVSLSAYGWSGPWHYRRGFDSLVQMSSGIANAGMKCMDTDAPRPLPVQALDHATGYLMAAAVLTALNARMKSGRILSAKLSLAKTAELLTRFPSDDTTAEFAQCGKTDLCSIIEETAWGRARRVRFPVSIEGCQAGWSGAAGLLRSAVPEWEA